MSSRSRWSPRLLALLLGAAGVAHLSVPAPYARIVPPALGAPYAWVYASGVAELLCAAGLLVPRTCRSAGLASAVLFVAVFPANVQMALDAEGRPAAYRALAYGRLPLQVPLVAWALVVAQRAGTPRRGRSRRSVGAAVPRQVCLPVGVLPSLLKQAQRSLAGPGCRVGRGRQS